MDRFASFGYSKALKLCSAILSSPLTKNVLMDHCRLPSSRTWRFLAGPHPTTYCSPPVRHSRSVLLIVRRKTSRPFTKISRTLLTSHKIITQITFFSKSDERKFLFGNHFLYARWHLSYHCILSNKRMKCSGPFQFFESPFVNQLWKAFHKYMYLIYESDHVRFTCVLADEWFHF